jgi:hypothetical protein
MSDPLAPGTRIQFQRNIYEPACGDHPEFILCRKGDGGKIVTHACGDKYLVQWDNWQSADFYAEAGQDFNAGITQSSPHPTRSHGYGACGWYLSSHE